jgi:hypothetical protein
MTNPYNILPAKDSLPLSIKSSIESVKKKETEYPIISLS